MDIKEVKATLRYGEYFSGKKSLLIFVCIAISMVFPIISIIMLILSLLNQLIFDNEIIIALVTFNIFSLLFLILMVIVAFKNIRHKKYIELCLANVVEIEANVIEYNRINSLAKQNQVLVNFILNNKEYNLTNKNGNRLIGYSKIFKEFLGNNKKLLYSKNYNEVLFIK